MISIVVYGRNDSHGYNMHKRVALSLNCMAAVLNNPADEIIFVDFNTQDDFPTLPEAIRDTLTPAARQRLRVLRVRRSASAQFQSRTHLAVAEPVARNVAVRRSNPANRWILSTNTDMIFTPRRDRSLSELAAGLSSGYYGIPRFELPESLWESLDRTQPQAVIPTVADWGWKFHLNEIVYGMDVTRFDAPGDFQLVERSDLFQIHGFNEEMLRGWHVDSNLCKRLNFLHGEVGDLSEGVYGYHCGHTRLMTLNHSRTRLEDKLSDFVHMVNAPHLPQQAQSWGLAHEQIEEIRLNGPAALFPAIVAKVAGPPLEKSLESFYVDATYDKVSYDPAHLLTFIADLFANVQKSASVAWVGAHKRMFDLFHQVRRNMGFSGPILVCARDADALCARNRQGVEVTDIAGICVRAGAFVFDYVRSDGGPIRDDGDGEELALARHLTMTFRRVVEADRCRSASGAPPRRVIGINAIHNRFEQMVMFHVDAARAPYNTRLRHGTITPFDALPADWLGPALIGPAGVRKGERIETAPGVEGHVVYGPYLPLTFGTYRVELDLEVDEPALSTRARGEEAKRVVYLEVISAKGENLFGFLEITRGELKSGQYGVTFKVGEEDEYMLRAVAMEARVWTSGEYRFAVTAVNVQRVVDVLSGQAASQADPTDWLALAAVGHAGLRNGAKVESAPGIEGHVLYGPYLPLAQGTYRAVFGIEAQEPPLLGRADTNEGPRAVRMEVVSAEGENFFGSVEIREGELKNGQYCVTFHVEKEDEELLRAAAMEVRVWTRGECAFAVTSVHVQRTDEPPIVVETPGAPAVQEPAGNE